MALFTYLITKQLENDNNMAGSFTPNAMDIICKPLLILFDAIISLPDATSYDKRILTPNPREHKFVWKLTYQGES